MRFSKREKILLSIVLIVALGAVYYFYFLSPFLSEMKSIKDDILKKQSELDILSLENSQLQILGEQIKDLEAQNDELSKKIPIGFDQPDLINFLHGLMEKYAQKMSFDFEAPADLVKIDKIKTTLRFFTNYVNFKAILRQLKESRFNNRILMMDAGIIDASSVSGAPEANSQYNLEVIMMLEFFNLKGEIPSGRAYDFYTPGSGRSNPFK